MVELARLKNEPDAVAERLLLDGGVIVENVVEPALLDQVLSDFRAPFDAYGDKFTNEFNGFKTRRIASILSHSEAAADIIAHPLVMQVADRVLKRHCESYRLGSSTAIEIHPGEGAQQLHRDDDFYPMRIPGVEFQISAMWAMTA